MKVWVLIFLLMAGSAVFAQGTGGVSMLPIPFEITIDPMEGLLLVNLEKDPDRIYLGFEPQVFDDPINGTGHLVIGWRVDGRVDVFHQPTLTLDPKKYDIAGKGLAHMVSREMAGAFFTVNDAGVQAYYAFQDLEGRSVEILISEQNPRKRRPFDLLAPMGDGAENPSALPLLFLHDFYFIRRRGTEVSVTIDGRSHRLDPFSFPMDGTMMYYARYSPDPLIVTLNPAFQGVLPFVDPAKGLAHGDTVYEIIDDKGHPVLKSMQKRHKEHLVTLTFEPAFPNLLALGEERVQGRFTVYGQPSTGQVTGVYSVESVDGQIQILLHPSGGWSPRPTSLTLRMIYSLAKVFTQWPKTYQWTATVHASDEGLVMSSSWERLK